MQSDQIIVFDVEGEYGHFRKFNTTTSPLTYAVPPRTALLGIIGAILGIEREQGLGQYVEGQIPLSDLLSSDKAQIAVQVLNPTQKTQMAFNLIDTEKTKSSFFNIKNRTQIEFELLKKPKFRVFLQWEEIEMAQELANKIRTRSNHFTVCLGLSQLVASTHWVGCFAIQRLAVDDFVPVISAVKMSLLHPNDPIKLQNNPQFRYISDTHPIFMTADRLVKEYAEVLIEANGQPIWVKSEHVVSVEELGNILFL